MKRKKQTAYSADEIKAIREVMHKKPAHRLADPRIQIMIGKRGEGSVMQKLLKLRNGSMDKKPSKKIAKRRYELLSKASMPITRVKFCPSCGAHIEAVEIALGMGAP